MSQCSCCNGPHHARPAGAPPPCPACGAEGEWVGRVTPRHTLQTPLRGMVMEARHYAFCATPDCPMVYYSADGLQRFDTDDLIQPVSCKSDQDETPLCYCFKERKGAVRAELAGCGESSVVARIEAGMAERGCFCEKSNPRGVCCLDEVRAWLERETR